VLRPKNKVPVMIKERIYVLKVKLMSNLCIYFELDYIEVICVNFRFKMDAKHSQSRGLVNVGFGGTAATTKKVVQIDDFEQSTG